MTKMCPVCNQEKPLSEYPRNKRYKLGVSSWCKVCSNANGRQRDAALIKRLKNSGVAIPPTKICQDCGVEKPSGLFFLSAHHSDGLRPRCRECFSSKVASRRKELRESSSEHKATQGIWSRRANLMGSYGITLERYEEMRQECDGVCSICRQEETWVGRKNLAVDHDHATGKIRGLLCSSCNKALGGFKDDPDLLKRAAEYLEKIEPGT